MAKASPDDISNWKNLISEQIESGLSIPLWCRQKGIPLYNFRYWHKKLFPKLIERSAFIEMTSQQTSLGINLEFHGVKIHLEPEFDSQTLQKCLEVIKRC